LSRMSEGMEGLNERRSIATRRRIASTVGLENSQLYVLRTTRAALLLLTSRLLALQLALGALAVGRLDALVVAFELFANRAAFGLGSRASSVALSRSTDSLTLGAIFLLAIVFGATN